MLYRWTAGGWQVKAGVLGRGNAPGWRTGEDILVWGGYSWQAEDTCNDARLIDTEFVNGEYVDE